MRVLCFAIAERGHTNPLLPSLQRLQRAGHDVVVAAADVVDVPAGITFSLLQANAPLQKRVTRGAAFAERLRDAAWLAQWIEALLLDPVDAFVPVCVSAIEAHRPDVVMLDPMFYAAVIASMQLRTPWVAVSSSLNPATPAQWTTALTSTMKRLASRREQLWRSRGLEPPLFRVADALSPLATIAFSTADYIGGDVDGVHLVGAPFSVDDCASRDAAVAFDVERLQPGPRVFVSFGSQAFFQPRLFGRVFAEARTRGMQVVASVGDLVDDATFMASVPAGSIVQRFVPQLLVLPHVDLVITHGGANSVVETLWMGKPLVVLPLCNDQPLQAAFVRRAGVGAVVDAASGDVDERALHVAVTGAFSCAARAKQVGERFRRLDGPARVVEIVEAVVDPPVDPPLIALPGAVRS
jgi:zeaxanthin glucosyltransferase